MTTSQELQISNRIYIALVVWTLVSVFAASFEGTRIMAVTLALAIAWGKAGLIGYYFMRLQHERPLIWVIVGIALLCVFILSVGVFPDLAIYVR